MFGPDEYRYFCTELGKVAGKVEEAREKLFVLNGELSDDGIGHSEETTVEIRAAVRHLRDTLAGLDSAVSALPVPTREER